MYMEVHRRYIDLYPPHNNNQKSNNDYDENNNHRHLATHLRPPVPPPRNRIVRGKKASPDALLVGGPVAHVRWAFRFSGAWS